MSRRIRSQKVVYDTLVPVAEQRCLERDLKNAGQVTPYHVGLPISSLACVVSSTNANLPLKADCIQWIMETSPKAKPWGPMRIVHELMAIWFGSVHAVSTVSTY